MSIKTMPPEAYTHKELAQAMNWREGQPEHIKGITTTPDTLMSVFKRVQRSGSGGLPEFKASLKNMAEEKVLEPKKVEAKAEPTVQKSYDEKTRAMIRSVKTQLNLSNEDEALRVLVKVGFDQLNKSLISDI